MVQKFIPIVISINLFAQAYFTIFGRTKYSQLRMWIIDKKKCTYIHIYC